MANAIIITLLCLNIVLQLVIGVNVLDEIEGIRSVEEVIRTSGQLAETAHQALDHAQTILEENERLRKEMANNEI